MIIYTRQGGAAVPLADHNVPGAKETTIGGVYVVYQGAAPTADELASHLAPASVAQLTADGLATVLIAKGVLLAADVNAARAPVGRVP